MIEKDIELSDVCINYNGIGCENSTWAVTASAPYTVVPQWTRLKFEPYWNSLGLSQVDQERPAIGRWSTYIPFNEPSNGQKHIGSTKLNKVTFSKMEQDDNIQRQEAQTILLDLCQQGIMEFQNIAVITGCRGIHIITPR